MSTTVAPTDEAWAYFMLHHDAIRECCAAFLPRPEFGLPNTRIAIEHPDGTEHTTESRAAIPLQPRYTLAAFDDAVKTRDSKVLSGLMNDAWLRAPESRSVYRI